MKRYIVIFLLFQSFLFSASSLIVFKTGSSVIASAVKKNGDNIEYKDQGAKKTIPVSKVYKILPKMNRGQTYKPQTIKKVIKMINQVRKKFPNIRKQTNSMLGEWKSLQKQQEALTPEKKAQMTQKITSIKTKYENSKKTYHSLTALRTDLGMIAYDDMQGVFDDQINEYLEVHVNGFVSMSIQKLKAAKISTVKGFLTIRTTLNDLRALQPTGDIKTELAAVDKSIKTK
ncbi:MAG: hypothetical protein HRT89_16790, partial [Lentisphaeria bacterium]|nr:hypothetical protein [Lentisphaeria bacterium]